MEMLLRYIGKMMSGNVVERIHSKQFYLTAWSKKNFHPRPSRCKIPFAAFIAFLLRPSKKSLQVELNHFLLENETMSNTYSKQAFSKRRQLIRPEAIKEIFQVATDTFYQEAEYKTLKGYVVAAIDGSRINLPDSPELKERFGSQITGNAPQNQALSSCAFDVLNGLYLDAVITPCKSSERLLAEQHIDYISRYGFEKILYLFDRGYPSHVLIEKLSASGASYLFRCDKTFVRGIATNGDDCVVTHQFKSAKEALTFRLVRLTLTDENGESSEEIFLTNLSADSFSKEELGDLYHLRWGIETSYDHAKNAVCLENFSGLSEVAIKQDYYAAMYLFNQSAGFAYDAELEFNAAHNGKGNKYVYKQNLSVAIGTLKPVVTKMILTKSVSERERYIRRINTMLIKATTKIEPNRHFERTKKHKTSKYPNNRRPIS